MNANAIKSPMRCAVCASDNLTSRMELEEFPYGAEGIPVILKASVRVYHCQECEFEFTGPGAVKARHDAVCRHLDLMTPGDIRELRGQYGLSRAEFASVTGIGEASIGRWEAGALLQSRANDNFLYLLQYKENLARLKNRSKPIAETTGQRQSKQAI